METNDYFTEEWYQKWTVRLLKYFNNLTGDVNLSQDLTQETLSRIHNYKNSYDSNKSSNPSSWVYKIAVNVLRKFYKQKNYLEISLDKNIYSSDFLAEKILENKECKEILKHCCGKLKPESQAIMQLKYEMDFTSNELGEIFRKKAGTIRSIIYYSLKKLRECLKEKGYEVK